jgi:tagatose-1,6-bisphosphate aldolase
VLSVLGYPPVSGGYVIQTITYKATKRAAPQVAVIAASQSTNISAVSIDDVTLEGCRYVATAGASGLLVGRGTWEATVEL